MTIKISIDGEVVHEIDARAYRKRIMHVDLRDAHASVKQEHIDLPIIRDLDINIVFDARADTDLHMLEEKARLDEADKDAERAKEAEEMSDEPEVEEPEVPQPAQEENVNPVLNPPVDPEAAEVDETVPDEVPSDPESADDSDDSDDSDGDEPDDSDESDDDGPLDLG